jgi:hypothetical protein
MISRKMIPVVLSILTLTAWAPRGALAAVGSLTDLSAFTQDAVDSIVQTMVVGGSHRAYRPATNLGPLGFDVGVEFTLLSIPQAFTDAMALGGTSVSTIPSAFPVPKLNIHKGLPWGVDLGLSYISLGSTAVTGFNAQWRFLNNVALPAVALRAGYTSFTSTEFPVNSSSFKFDVVASKNLFLIDPYIGAGVEFGSGELNIDTSALGLPGNVSASSSVVSPHIFVGLPLKLAFFQFVGEFDYSLTAGSNYGGKVSFAF